MPSDADNADQCLLNLAYALLPIQFKRFSYTITYDRLWRYISTGYRLDLYGRQQADGSEMNPVRLAAERIALVVFPLDEIMIAAGNAGNRKLAGIAGYMIKYSRQDEGEPEATLSAATLETAARISNMPGLKPNQMSPFPNSQIPYDF